LRKKILQSTEIALSLTLDFQVSPLAIDKTATKNQAKIQLKQVLTGDRESGYDHTLSKASQYSVVLSRAQVYGTPSVTKVFKNTV